MTTDSNWTSTNLKKFAMVEKCSDTTKWYANSVHCVYPVIAEYSREVLVRTQDSYNTSNFIANEDCSFVWKVETIL